MDIPKSRESTLNLYLRQLIEARFIRKTAHQSETGSVYPLYHIHDEGQAFLEEMDIPKKMQETIQQLEGVEG